MSDKSSDCGHADRHANEGDLCDVDGDVRVFRTTRAPTQIGTRKQFLEPEGPGFAMSLNAQEAVITSEWVEQRERKDC